MEKHFICDECGFESTTSNSIINPEKHKNVHKILELLDDISVDEIDFIWSVAEEMSGDYYDERMKLKPEQYTDERFSEDLEKMSRKKKDNM